MKFSFKSSRKALLQWGFLMSVLALVVVFSSACASTESENLSARPWNTPRNWENGIPAAMTEGR